MKINQAASYYHVSAHLIRLLIAHEQLDARRDWADEFSAGPPIIDHKLAVIQRSSGSPDGLSPLFA